MGDLFSQNYPEDPGYQNTDTSKQAAEDMGSKASTIRGKVLDALSDIMPMTPDEMANYLGMDKLSVRPRFSELRAKNLIMDTGERRANGSGKKAIVWSVI